MNEKVDNLLLLSCCAPCSCGVIKTLAEQGRSFTVFFYNPNIRPWTEYLRRREENKRVCVLYGVPFVEAEYDNERWCALTKGLESEPERGLRCDVCFQMRLKKAFEYARQNGFSHVSSVLGFSRYKDFDQVNRAAVVAGGADLYQMINWRKGGIQELSVQLAKELSLYHQNYCGCTPWGKNDTGKS